MANSHPSTSKTQQQQGTQVLVRIGIAVLAAVGLLLFVRGRHNASTVGVREILASATDLSPNMSRTEVIALLGEPDDTETRGDNGEYEECRWGRGKGTDFCGATVFFKNGVVLSVKRRSGTLVPDGKWAELVQNLRALRHNMTPQQVHHQCGEPTCTDLNGFPQFLGADGSELPKEQVRLKLLEIHTWSRASDPGKCFAKVAFEDGVLWKVQCFENGSDVVYTLSGP